MIPAFTVISGIFTRAVSGLATTAGIAAVAFLIGGFLGYRMADRRAEVAALTAQRDTARADLALHKANAERAEAMAAEARRLAEERQTRLEEFLKETVDAPLPPPRPDICPPCADRVRHIDLERLRNLAR
jgi:hypothetical protein